MLGDDGDGIYYEIEFPGGFVYKSGQALYIALGGVGAVCLMVIACYCSLTRGKPKNDLRYAGQPAAENPSSGANSQRSTPARQPRARVHDRDVIPEN